jgi:tRNA U34 5-methylaminomethyl-2-thiouridine-forming methyltransferase MnmC
MTSSASAADGLLPRIGADGSFSLWSEAFGEGFHSAVGARREALETYVQPAGLDRFPPGSRITVVDVCLGLGTNTAALLAAARERDLVLRWWGLEVDRRPLERALAEPRFRQQWPVEALAVLEQLAASGQWRSPAGAGRVCWGDARRHLPGLLTHLVGACDLVLLDAFSPRRCPQLWTQEFLTQLAGLLAPEGRLLTYCSAAAVRRSLQRAGLELAAISGRRGSGQGPAAWSQGTAASPSPLAGDHDRRGDGAVLRPLGAMEREHLGTRAAVPYSDPSGEASAAAILAARERTQADSVATSTSAWRRRWGLA